MFLVWCLKSIIIGVIMARSVVINSDKSDGVHLAGEDDGGGGYGNLAQKNIELDGATRTGQLSIDSNVRLHSSPSRHVTSHQENKHVNYANHSFTPEYMLELYEKMSKSPPLSHTSNIIRSFQNIAKEGKCNTNVIEWGERSVLF